MASRNSSASMPAQKKLVTYGKVSRKRQTLDSSSSRSASVQPASSKSIPGVERTTPRLPSDMAHGKVVDETSTIPMRNERQPQAHDPTELSRKRKRIQGHSPQQLDKRGEVSDDTHALSEKSSKPSSLLLQQRSKSVKTNTTQPIPRSDYKSVVARRTGEATNMKTGHKVAEESISGYNKPNPPSVATPPGQRRRRLIDTLVAQRSESPELDSPEDQDDSRHTSGSAGRSNPNKTVTSTPKTVDRLHTRPGVVLHGKRVKYTYGQTRNILATPQGLDDGATGNSQSDLDGLLSGSQMSNPDPFAMSDDEVDDDEIAKPAIKSVHELRRAGANNRFSDEMEDLVSRIGSATKVPSTMRRNALLELVQKLQGRDFISQFRDHGTRDNVFQELGQEEDAISGFALTAVLVIFLDFNPAPHLVRQLIEDELVKLLRRLLSLQMDIEEMASDGAYRMPKATKLSIRAAKEVLTKMDFWHSHKLQKLPPQTLALQLLNILCRRIDPGYSAGLVRELESDLVPIMGRFKDAKPGQEVEFRLICSIMEAQSSLNTGDEDDLTWVSRQTSMVSCFLRNCLRSWPEVPGDIELTIVKLAINTSNTTLGATGFNHAALLSSLADRVYSGLHLAQETVSRGGLNPEAYNGLLLVLGVMINILEHCPPARDKIGSDSVEQLLTLYSQHSVASREADSVEKSQLSVAFGYLAVSLGYIALGETERFRMVNHTISQGVSGLVGSIQEFIAMYRSVDSKVHELEGLATELQHKLRSI